MKSITEQFARHRLYLQLLAEAELGERLRVRVSPSDIVQETLLEAVRDHGQFRGTTERELIAWLRRILLNNLLRAEERHLQAECRDVRREVRLTRSRIFEESAQRLEESLVAASPRPVDALEQGEMLAAMAEALHALSPEHRRVLLLRNYMGLPFQDVAIAMQRSVPASRMLWLRALDALREKMDISEY